MWPPETNSATWGGSEALPEAALAYRRYLELAPAGLYAETVRRQLQRIDAKLPPGPAPQ